jgi:1-deoxy-D-xylulose-5-phosphate reductoisomerase
MKKRRVVILGATGSIGQSAAKVARDIPGRMEIVGLSGNRNLARLGELAAEFPRAALCTTCPHTAIPAELEPLVGHRGEQGLIELATLPDADLVLIAIVGTGGLKPALAAIEAGKDIAVASKEILVMAGEAVMEAARRKGVKVLPVDSEHNAIFQCLEGRDSGQVRRLILTASGGPFRTLPAADLVSVTREQALRHPTWNMGEKVTIDSATLFNKGLEMIEARWLFDIEMARVDVIVHPQSIIHSMVEFVDGSVVAGACAEYPAPPRFRRNLPPGLRGAPPARLPGPRPRPRGRRAGRHASCHPQCRQ